MEEVKAMIEDHIYHTAYVIFCNRGFFRMWDYLEDQIAEYLITAEQADQIERKVFDKYASWD